MSVVYFIQAGTDGPIKIGVASNVRRRVQMLQIGCPVPLVVLAITDGGREMEAALHRAHRSHLVRGEWFKPSPAVLASVEAARPLPSYDAKAHPIRPTDLASALGCSVPYASQLLTGAREITVARALLILDKTGHRLGPLADASDEEIETLRKFTQVAA